MEIGKTLYVTKAAEWRRWLKKNHANEPEIWLIYYKKDSDKPSIPYNDAMEEALCFGWIDSIVKKHGAETRAQRFSPRRPKSPLSEMNKARVRRLNEAGKMTPAGLAAAGDILDEPFNVPADILKALKEDDKALKKDDDIWRNFQAFPESYKRIRVGWIDASRSRPDFFDQRLRYFLKMTKQNKRFGMGAVTSNGN